jgi:hypothetical protein
LGLGFSLTLPGRKFLSGAKTTFDSADTLMHQLPSGVNPSTFEFTDTTPATRDIVKFYNATTSLVHLKIKKI